MTEDMTAEMREEITEAMPEDIQYINDS